MYNEIINILRERFNYNDILNFQFEFIKIFKNQDFTKIDESTLQRIELQKEILVDNIINNLWLIEEDNNAKYYLKNYQLFNEFFAIAYNKLLKYKHKAFSDTVLYDLNNANIILEKYLSLYEKRKNYKLFKDVLKKLKLESNDLIDNLNRNKELTYILIKLIKFNEKKVFKAYHYK